MSDRSDSPEGLPRFKHILWLAIFFLGIGFYALVGGILQQSVLLEAVTLTYLSVGIVIGGIGVLLLVLLWYR